MRKLALALALAAACDNARPPGPPPPRPSSPLLEVEFNPEKPMFHPTGLTDEAGKKLYDYARFSVTITNKHPKPILMVAVRLAAVGDQSRLDLGDIRDVWQYPNPDRSLDPGMSSNVHRVWGFPDDTPNRALTYVFEFEYRVGDAKAPTYTRAELKLEPD